jgi:hypothetical protein
MASIQDAVDAYRRNPKASITDVAKAYKVPRGTLWSRIYTKPGLRGKQRIESPGADEETSPERAEGHDESDDQGRQLVDAVVVERNPNMRQLSEGPTKRSRHDVEIPRLSHLMGQTFRWTDYPYLEPLIEASGLTSARRNDAFFSLLEALNQKQKEKGVLQAEVTEMMLHVLSALKPRSHM